MREASISKTSKQAQNREARRCSERSGEYTAFIPRGPQKKKDGEDGATRIYLFSLTGSRQEVRGRRGEEEEEEGGAAVISTVILCAVDGDSKVAQHPRRRGPEADFRFFLQCRAACPRVRLRVRDATRPVRVCACTHRVQRHALCHLPVGQPSAFSSGSCSRGRVFLVPGRRGSFVSPLFALTRRSVTRDSMLLHLSPICADASAQSSDS